MVKEAAPLTRQVPAPNMNMGQRESPELPSEQEGIAAVWKVYNIQTGRIVKAGFDSDEQAKDWLERRKDLADDEFDVDEMDEEEEEEFLESDDDDEEETPGDLEPEFVEEEAEVREGNFDDLDEGGGATVADDADEDEEEEADDEEEEEKEEEPEDDDY